MGAPGPAGQIGAGAGDRKINAVHQSTGYRMSRQTNADFTASCGKFAADGVCRIKYQGQAAWPKIVHESLGIIRDIFDEAAKLVCVFYQYQNRVVARSLFELEYLFHGIGGQGIGRHSVEEGRRKNHQAAGIENTGDLIDNVGIQVEFVHPDGFVLGHFFNV